MGSWRAVVLAAGQGTRMNSDLAKVLHPLAGKSLLSHVLTTASRLPIERTIVVIGHQHERVRAAHAEWGVEWVLQEPQRGTGHAVQQAESFLRGHEGSTLILYGDVPLLRRSTLLELMEEHRHQRNAATVLTSRVLDPSGYGRIVRAVDGSLDAIVEDKDLRPDQRGIDEINSGIYAYESPELLASLGGLTDDNKQKELYLTDTLHALRARGRRVGTYTMNDPLEISGINTVAQLAAAEEVLEGRARERTLDCPTCDLGREDHTAEFPILARRPGAILAVDTSPYNSGQLVSHPRRHVLRHSDLDEGERRDLWELGKIGAALVTETYHPQGMNLGYNSGKPGEHLALRIIPRWVGDTNFLPLLADLKLLHECLERTYQRMRESLASTAGGE
jgi:CTP:molybdopterin cytidylyltransferase MocA/diadenosine tetraphosphate (Ap4A) HIT family hydrolase